jgi:hypothetical protein
VVAKEQMPRIDAGRVVATMLESRHPLIPSSAGAPRSARPRLTRICRSRPCLALPAIPSTRRRRASRPWPRISFRAAEAASRAHRRAGLRIDASGDSAFRNSCEPGGVWSNR